MKFAIVFLFALTGISHQQMQHPEIWLAPYYSPPQPFINNYQSPYYDDLTYFDQDMNDNEYYESRIRGTLDAQQQQNARFLFNRNRITLTVTLTTTTVKSCVPAAQLTAGAVGCRRKRRQIRELDDSPIVSEYAQFFDNPSETLKVIPTALLSSDKTHALSIDTYPDGGLLSSSKDEVPLGDEISKVDQTNLRDKRFFFNFMNANNWALMGSPATSYVFVPTTVVKTVSLGGLASVLCLPANYQKC